MIELLNLPQNSLIKCEIETIKQKVVSGELPKSGYIQNYKLKDQRMNPQYLLMQWNGVEDGKNKILPMRFPNKCDTIEYVGEIYFAFGC